MKQDFAEEEAERMRKFAKKFKIPATFVVRGSDHSGWEITVSIGEKNMSVGGPTAAWAFLQHVKTYLDGLKSMEPRSLA